MFDKVFDGEYWRKVKVAWRYPTTEIISYVPLKGGYLRVRFRNSETEKKVIIQYNDKEREYSVKSIREMKQIIENVKKEC